MADTMRIVLAEDQGMLRGALGALLSLQPGIQVVGEAANGEEALALILAQQPEICILDIEMPLMSGLAVAERLQVLRHPTRVVILTTFARPGYFERAVKAGVWGYLLKDGPSTELAAALWGVMAGRRTIAPELAFAVVRDPNPLTERERAVLRLAGEGMSSKEIGARLFLSNGTVRNYLSEALAKLGVGSRIEAVKLAEEKGWLAE